MKPNQSSPCLPKPGQLIVPRSSSSSHSRPPPRGSRGACPPPRPRRDRACRPGRCTCRSGHRPGRRLRWISSTCCRRRQDVAQCRQEAVRAENVAGGYGIGHCRRPSGRATSISLCPPAPAAKPPVRIAGGHELTHFPPAGARLTQAMETADHLRAGRLSELEPLFRKGKKKAVPSIFRFYPYARLAVG